MASNPKLEFGMICEFRNPEDWRRPFRVRYDEAIEAIVWAEQIGYDAIYFTEHHLSEDDYLTSPLMSAAIVAEKTKRIRISTSVLLLPFYNPVRLAEDGAFLDQLSEGRYELGFATGYRPEEYAGFGLDWTKRGAQTDEIIEIIKRLWTEDYVTFHGKHFQIENAYVRPRPVQQPHPPILVGGFVRAATRRAARFGDGLLIGLDYAKQYPEYVEELEAAGKDPGTHHTYAGWPWTFVSEDPERTWDALSPYVTYQMNYYFKWGNSFADGAIKPIETKEDLRASGVLRVLTPDEMIATIRDMALAINMKRYHFYMNPGGIPMPLMQEPIETFASKVIPAFR